MIKKFVLASVLLSQLTISCSSDESTVDENQSLTEQIAAIVKQPYSDLTPDQQKIKLEAEANDMLLQLDKSKSSSAVDAIENLGRLLDISSVDIFNGKNDNQIEDVLNVSDVYGIYTWNNAQQKWNKTASTTDLQFVFPATKTQTANNATLSAKSTSSDVKVYISDSYNWENNIETNDHFFLPTSSNATLKIDNKEAAIFSQAAKYGSKNEVPVEFSYKMSVNDGYTWEMSGQKNVETSANASLTFNGKNLIKFNAGSTADIDALITDEELTQYRGTANGLVQLMDNFVIVADMDLATAAKDDAALEKSLVYPKYPNYEDPKADYKAYYTAENAYNEKHSQATVTSFNKNMKLILVSKKDGTKIADIVQRSKKGYTYDANLPVWVTDNYYANGGIWANHGAGGSFIVQNYDEELYLKFGDNTEVEMSAYFSKGFENFEAKFEEFIKAFETK